MKDVGIFVCRGELEGLRLELSSDDVVGLPGAKWIGHHSALCSPAGRRFLEEAIERERLKGVIALCPYSRLYRESFQKEMARMGFPPVATRLLEPKPEEWGNGKKTELLERAVREMKDLIKEAAGK